MGLGARCCFSSAPDSIFAGSHSRQRLSDAYVSRSLVVCLGWLLRDALLCRVWSVLALGPLDDDRVGSDCSGVQPNRMKAWVTYFAVFGVCCLICPPLLGIGLGIGVFCFVWWVGFKMIGG